MAITPERNLVDVSRLFNWGKYFEIVDNKGVLITGYYLRLPTDEEINKARIYALRKSAEMRKKLKDPASDERLAFVVDKESITKEQLTEIIIFYTTKQLVSKTYSELDFPFPKELDSDATLEQQEKYQEEVDAYPAKREEYVKNKVNADVEKEKKRLLETSFKELYKMYEDMITEDVCQKQMVNSFRDYCVFYGSHSDEKYKEKLFETVDDLNELPEQIKAQFIAHFLDLDIDVEELKK